MAGLVRQDKDFWRYIERYDYIGLYETWVNEKGWDNIRKRLPDTYEWISKHVEKKKKKGRAIKGIVVGKSKE